MNRAAARRPGFLLPLMAISAKRVIFSVLLQLYGVWKPVTTSLMKTLCEHPRDGRNCPISEAPCPGACIFSDILNNVQVGILVLNIRRRDVFFQNEAAAELLGHGDGAPDFDTLWSLFAREELLQYPLKCDGASRSIALGSRILGYSIFHLVKDYVWLFIRDITEKARFQSIAGAVCSMESLGYVFSGMRHEIGNPVNSAKMALSVLRDNLEQFSRDRTREYVDRSLNELLRMEYLLKSLKTFTMFEKPEVRNMDIPAFIENLKAIAGKDLEMRGIRISMDIQYRSRWARADGRALHQVFLNLLENAADALVGNPDPFISINLRNHSGLHWITVMDNGCGISEEQMPDIFKPFHTSKVGGTGLGLVICRKMLAAMNGTISISSQASIGTTVEISVPEAEPGGRRSAH